LGKVQLRAIEDIASNQIYFIFVCQSLFRCVSHIYANQGQE